MDLGGKEERWLLKKGGGKGSEPENIPKGLHIGSSERLHVDFQ